MNEASGGVCQSQPRSARPLARSACASAHSVIHNLHRKHVARSMRRDPDPPGRCTWTYSVADRVLQQRLQKEAGHHRASRLVTDVEVHVQLVLKAHSLDPQVSLEELELAVQGHLVLHRT